MPSSDSTTRLLYAILSQKCLKDIDWNRVAAHPALTQENISNGHAARMRYSRFKKQMEPPLSPSTTTTPRKPREAKQPTSASASASPRKHKIEKHKSTAIKKEKREHAAAASSRFKLETPEMTPDIGVAGGVHVKAESEMPGTPDLGSRLSLSYMSSPDTQGQSFGCGHAHAHAHGHGQMGDDGSEMATSFGMGGAGAGMYAHAQAAMMSGGNGEGGFGSGYSPIGGSMDLGLPLGMGMPMGVEAYDGGMWEAGHHGYKHEAMGGEHGSGSGSGVYVKKEARWDDTYL